jgi:tRNA(fMet)-specific endonuclease VapC
MPYLIDSDWTIDHLAEVPEAEQLLAQLAPDGIAISIVTYMEIYEGALRAPDQEQALRKLDALLNAVPVAPFDSTVARLCAEIRNQLRRQKRRVNSRALDLIVAVTALALNLTLVTRNIRDYADVPDLVLYRP